jgi:hypothetical protein
LELSLSACSMSNCPRLFLWEELVEEEQEDCTPLFPFVVLLFFSVTAGLPTLVASSYSPSGCR